MTNQEIAQKREEMLASMSDEKRQAFLDAEAAYDRLKAIEYSEKLGVPVEIVPGDPNSIRVDGLVMGYNEFAEYCDRRLPHEEECEDDFDDEDDYDDFDDDDDSEDDF